MKRLRRVLVDFAAEEELHYLVAATDLQRTGLGVLDCPLDVELWHAYFRDVVQRQPFKRLGAACVLEGLAGPSNRELLRQVLSAPFLGRENTKFVALHMHEAMPHGDQLLDAIRAEQLSPENWRHLCEGARNGATMYLRMVEWTLDTPNRTEHRQVEELMEAAT